MNEESWVITGTRFGGLWLGWLRWRSEGEPHQVGFAWDRVLKRHLHQRDLIGFAHTHPGMMASPSHTDVCTMQAWCLTLGRPLLCAIKGIDGWRAFVFQNDECHGKEVMKVYGLEPGLVLGVEHGRRRPRAT